jgi:hypothetical protein
MLRREVVASDHALYRTEDRARRQFKFMILLYVKTQEDPPCTRETCSATASAVARIIVEVMNVVGEDHEDVATHHLPTLA